MMEEWVDDCWKEMEVQIMALTGDDFRHRALAPYDANRIAGPAADASAEAPTGHDATDANFRSRRRSDTRAVRSTRSYSHYAALARRNSERCAPTTRPGPR